MLHKIYFARQCVRSVSRCVMKKSKNSSRSEEKNSVYQLQDAVKRSTFFIRTEGKLPKEILGLKIRKRI